MRRRTALCLIGGASVAAAFGAKLLFDDSRPRPTPVGGLITNPAVSQIEAEIVLASITEVMREEGYRPLLVDPELGSWKPAYADHTSLDNDGFPERHCCGNREVDLAMAWQTAIPPAKTLAEIDLPEDCGWSAFDWEAFETGFASLSMAHCQFLRDGRVISHISAARGPLFGAEKAVLFERTAAGWTVVDSTILGIY